MIEFNGYDSLLSKKGTLGMKILLLLLPMQLIAYRAMVVKPVIDVLGEPTREQCLSISLYNTMAYAPESGNCCPRIYQLLLHEMVEVLEEKDNEVKITVPNIFYGKKDNPYCNEFWTLKENLVNTEELDQEKIPTMTNFTTNSYKKQHNELYLIKPLYIKDHNYMLSAATKVVADTTLEDPYYYKVFIYNPGKKQFESKKVNKKYFFSNTKHAIKDFIAVLQKWTHPKHGFIPYVWGGGSFCYTVHQPYHLEKTKSMSCWTYEHSHNPKCGMDCSSLIVRASQVAQLPYYFRNTTTLGDQLQELTPQEKVENGDLILFKGHVIIITDVLNDMCIEARGYGQGFGKVQEIPIYQLFKGVRTISALKQKYLKKSSLERLDSRNRVAQLIPEFKIIKLKSVFNWEYT